MRVGDQKHILLEWPNRQMYVGDNIKYNTIVTEARGWGAGNTVESRNWTKQGRGLIRGIVIFICDDHYRLTNATWARSLHFLWQFDGQNSRKVTK